MKKFTNAFNGLKLAFQDKNVLILMFLAVVALACGLVFHFDFKEYLIIFIFIGLVISLEIVNSTIELICDFIQPQYHQAIKKIKDLSAAAVLWSSIIALICGITIIIKHLIGG